MRYTESIRKAANIAVKAHGSQMDKCGMPYIMHPIHLAEQMKTEDEIVVALLHDVVEDTDVTLYDLVVAGFNEDVVEAIKLITRDKSIPYSEYIDTLKTNDLARRVKICDLLHNSNAERSKMIPGGIGIKLIERYNHALTVLQTYERGVKNGEKE